MTSIASDEPGGAGDTVLSGGLAVLLRSQRSAGSTGRTDTITVECRDMEGNEATIQGSASHAVPDRVEIAAKVRFPLPRVVRVRVKKALQRGTE